MLEQKFFVALSRNKNIRKVLAVSTLVLLSSCSFKSASGVATEQLSQRGAFVGQAPEWVHSSHLTQSKFPGQSQGYGNSIGGGARNSISRNVFERQHKQEETIKKLKPKIKPKESSPLDRIVEVCPRVEEQINKALVTTETAERIKQYESITKRCAISADLWIWLGNAYLENSDYIQAKSCAEKAISLDARNKEAAELMNKASSRKAQKK